MKKIFSTVLAVLLLTIFPLNILAQEDTSTSATDDTSTTDSEELTSTSEEESTSATDETASTTEETATDGTAEESNSFLDNIDTMWLWVILGVGGVVLIGSLIGIISLSKKEKKESNTIIQEPVSTTTSPATNVEAAPEKEEKEEVVQQKQEINEVPVTPVINDIKPEETAPSIKDTLGEASSYQQPEVNEQVVSNIAPTADINKDLADLNTAVQIDKEPEVSDINSTQVPTETVVAQTDVLPEMQNNTPIAQEQVSMPNPQNQESPVINENPVNEGFNQPINTTSL